MRMKSLLHYTEHHRYYTYRDFSLSSLDERMLTLIYQPMVGASAVGLYRLLAQHLPSEQTGYSKPEPHKGLFLTLGVEPSERGRTLMIENASKLEAVGLLQTHRLYLPEQDQYMYEYELQQPLPPSDFFATQHLTLLLRDRIGKFAVLSLQERFWNGEPEELGEAGRAAKENISQPFYEIFELNTHVIDYELEQALSEASPARRQSKNVPAEEPLFDYSDVILHFPRGARNRSFVEGLRHNREQMGMINHVARKFDLNVEDIVRLLDEEGIFTQGGELLLDNLQNRANLTFRQTAKRTEERQVKAARAVRPEEPAPDDTPVEHAVEMEYYLEVPQQFQSKCDIHQYNMLLRNEPYTGLLRNFFPGTVPGPWLDMFSKIDLSYKLPGEVINVLIHYLVTLLGKDGDQRISRNFVDSIASNMLLRQIDTYEKAVRYIRDQDNPKRKPSAQTGGRARTSGKASRGKPELPIVQNSPVQTAVSDEEFAEYVRMAEEMKASKNKSRN
ncbi:DnaD domain protein [Saccharibacillus sp. CPCC 101409]|uniref:DnaD domain protein n=1 Tax=Saccharibacillus sp. CPCC 101409 TaxID=3058041 RepID=UPI002673C7F6|nr:DnaD domain protein [Saccharibacillus sp. CPCC 101409]MDO3411038.1 DnaD domain protein [Saccharibacillus sp. CPCC 101409]